MFNWRGGGKFTFAPSCKKTDESIVRALMLFLKILRTKLFHFDQKILISCLDFQFY
jgi:hypothetical protein